MNLKGLRTNNTNVNETDILRAYKEGWALPNPFGFGVYVNNSDIDISGQSTNILSVGTAFNGFLCLCSGINISTSKSVHLQLVSNTYPSGDGIIMPGNPSFDYRDIVNGHVSLPGPFILDGHKQLRVQILEEVAAAGIHITGGVKVCVNLVNPHRLTLSQLNRADKVMFCAGDSITGLTSVGTRLYLPDDLHMYKIENGINQNYFTEGRRRSIRSINKAIGGQNIFQAVKYVRSHMFDVDQVDVFYLAYGTNEASGNMSPEDFVTYLDTIWQWFKWRYPGAHMVAVGAPPLNNNTDNTRLIALRAAELAWVNEVADERLSYMTYENAFDRTNLANYNASDGVHPTGVVNWDIMADLYLTHLLNNAHAREALGLPAAA